MTYRDRFSSFEGVAYLDTATQGPLPLAAARAGREAIALKEHPYRISDGLHLKVTGELRALFARLFSCREESVALTTGLGAAVNLVARGLDLGEGDEVLLPPGESPSSYYPWAWLARRGVRLVEAEPDDPVSGAASAQRLAELVGPRTRVVAFAHVSALHGGRIDPTPVVEAARRIGAVTVVDGSLAAGAIPFDFGASGVDVYGASCHAYLLGPYGTGVGLFAPSILDRLGVGDVSGWTVKGGEQPDHLPRPAFELRPGAQRHDAHEPASFHNLMPLAESLRLVLEATPSGVQTHCRALCDRLLHRLPEGFRSASPLEPDRRSQILCIAADTPMATAQAHARLLAARVQVSLRAGRLRISPHLHSADSDVERLLSVLAG